MKLSQFLGVVVFSILLATILYYNLYALDTPIVTTKKEGFEDMTGRLTACPTGTTSYTTVKGDINCCSGDVNGNNCNGKVLCTMSAPSKNIVSCSDYLNDKFKEPQATFCSSDLPNYFEAANGEGGCTNGSVKGDKSGPVDPDAKVCNVWNNKILDENDPNSCYNIKLDNQYSTETNLVQGNCPPGKYKFGKFAGGICSSKPINWDPTIGDFREGDKNSMCFFNLVKWKSYLVSQKMSDQEINNLMTTFGKTCPK
jgi:hypothetical protein